MNLFAEIIPLDGLGDIHLGTTLDEYSIIHDKVVNKKGNCYIYLKEGAIFLLLNNKNNKNIIQISALAGYKGLLAGRYKVGMPISEILVDPDWEYDDSIEGFISNKYPGVSLLTELEDTDLDEIIEKKKNLTVTEITVFNSNLFR